MRRVVIANWKMKLSVKASAALAKKVVAATSGVKNITVALCPSFPAIAAVAEAIHGSKLAVGGQDLFWADVGQYTGEVSPLVLKELGCRYVIVGHSERRTHLGETDAMVARKVPAALKAGLTPIVCLGETLSERDSGRRDEVVARQVMAACESVAPGELSRLVVAYEPVWAIGSGDAVSPAEAVSARDVICRELARKYGQDAAAGVRVIYGGSVDGANARGFFRETPLAGALVGGASLHPEEFLKIVKAAAED